MRSDTSNLAICASRGVNGVDDSMPGGAVGWSIVLMRMNLSGLSIALTDYLVGFEGSTRAAATAPVSLSVRNPFTDRLSGLHEPQKQCGCGIRGTTQVHMIIHSIDTTRLVPECHDQFAKNFAHGCEDSDWILAPRLHKPFASTIRLGKRRAAAAAIERT